MKDQETTQKFIELRSQGWTYARLEAELASREVKDLSTTQLYGLARQLRRQLQEATGSVRFTTPVAQIPGDEFHEQVHDWQG
jgi:hypothetical protein